MTADYKLLSHPDAVLRVSDDACITLVDGACGYAEYQAWLAAGNTPDPADPLPPPPPVDLQVMAQTDTSLAGLAGMLDALKTMTPEQVAMWVDANITDLPGAINGIKMLAVATCITRRQIRGESQ
jgi:hypothetical protein